MQIKELGHLPARAMSIRVFRTALSTFIGQRMAAGYDLRYGSNYPVTQTATADNEVAQLVQQAVTDVVFRL